MSEEIRTEYLPAVVNYRRGRLDDGAGRDVAGARALRGGAGTSSANVEVTR